MEQIEHSRNELKRALEVFESERNLGNPAALLDAIRVFELEVSAHVDGAYLRQLLSTARQCIQDDQGDGAQLAPALMDLRSATELGSEKPPLPESDVAIADATPAVKGA